MKKGWETRRLGDVCEIIKGRKPALKTIATNGDLPYLVAKVMRGSKEAEYASVKDKNSITVEESETIMICDGSNSGEVFTGFRGILSSTMGKIAKKAEIDDDYLRAFLASTFDVFNGAKTGAAIPHLDKDAMYSLEFPLPPISEQQKIVGILDEASENIAIAKANAEKNLQNACALFESHLQSVFAKRGPEWVEKKFEDVCHKITDGTHHSPQIQFTERGKGRFPYITSKNIRNNYMDLSKISYIEQAFHDEVYARCQPSLGDVLLTKDGANTGNVTLNTLDEPFSLLSSVCLIKTNQAVLKPMFLCYYLQSSTGLSSIVGQMTGAAIKRIILKDIKQAVIPFPSLKEQNNIVKTLNLLLTETQCLAKIYEQKLSALEELKKSLLHQAFTGELTKDKVAA